MEDNIFKFEDFLLGKQEKLKSIKKILESIEQDDFQEEEEDFATDSTSEEEQEDYSSTQEEEEEDDMKYEEEEEEEEVEKPEPKISEKYYNLYSDKSENFVCDIAIQGADPKQTQARLVVESGDWTLMFYGEVKGQKCTIPIKKLNILKEGQVGDIRLEVIAEGNLFVPWEDKFKVRVSKKVTVKVNEQKDYYSRPTRKNLGVKVKVKR